MGKCCHLLHVLWCLSLNVWQLFVAAPFLAHIKCQVAAHYRPRLPKGSGLPSGSVVSLNYCVCSAELYGRNIVLLDLFKHSVQVSEHLMLRSQQLCQVDDGAQGNDDSE